MEAVLGEHPGVQEACVVVGEDHPGEKRLVAYYVGAGVEPEALRGYLRAKLPEYMVPGALMGLVALPLNPNGKVDRKALPVPERGGATEAYEAPRTPTEELLAGIWAEVLRQERVGRRDNFFALGGDSILSIQIVARAQQAGLHVTLKQLFQYQSIAELGAMVGIGPGREAEQGVVSGEVPLTPIQRWFFEQHQPEPQHFNQAVLLEVGAELKPSEVQRVVRHLLAHHDALRLRFIPEAGGWRQVHAGLEGAVPFAVVDLSGLAHVQQRLALEAVAEVQQASLDLSTGPLLGVVLFQLGPRRPGRLLIVIHHLAVDGVSWRILLEDFQHAYGQLSRGEAIQVPPKTTAFKAWAERLGAYRHSAAVRAELDYWRGVCQEVVPLPRDYPTEPEANTVAAAAEVGVALSAEQTRALLQEVPPVYHTQINDVLLTALVGSFGRWTGQSALLLDLEGHGREELFEGVDLARTVGWFTSLFPVRLKLETEEPGVALKAVKEQLRAIPRAGIGYGVLRYLRPDPAVRAALHGLPQAEVSFNYLGQLDPMLSDGSLFGPAPEGSGPPHSPRGQRPHLLDINGFVAGGRLQLQWTYSTRAHRRATVERLARGFLEALEALIAHCQSPEAGDYTPSDFPEINLNQEQLEGILERMASENKAHSIDPKKDVEAIYPLSPSQQGMLIETLSAPRSGIHVEQSVLRLYSDFDLKAFTRAWQQVMERHPVLRTAFVWEDLEEPLQTVLRGVKLPLQHQDWRSLTPSQQREQLEHYMDNERSQGFKLTQAPLMRLAVFQIDGQAHEFVWTCHHILMDGWCKTLVQQEVLRLYEVYRRSQDLWLEPSPPYRNYIAWLRQQDSSAAEAFWRLLLQGFTKPTPLGMTGKPIDPPEPRYGNQQACLDTEESAVLQALVQRHRVTLNSLIQGVWALLLSRYSGQADIVFGATVSGRPADLPRVESMVGLFINTLPVRIQFAPDTPLWSWLEAIQTQNQERSPYEYCAAGQVHRWSDLPGTLPLYESIVVFENYPTNESSLQHSSELNPGISETHSLGAQTRYALTLLAIPGPRLGVQIVYDRARSDDSDIGWILEHFLRLLRCILTGQEVRLAALAGQIPTEQIPQFRPLLTRQAPYIAPRDSLEQQLAEIWQEILQVSPVGIQDNLFDLGGHSLLAVHLLARIGQQIGKPMPLAILLRGATIEQLAAILRQQSPDLPWSPLVAIQPNGAKLPFFCMPGGGGNVIYLYELARHLGPDQPFYGLQAVGLDGKSRPHTRIEDMAACYIEQIRTVQPQGPYLLGGHSFGGNVAFEMSQQLQRQGQDIALLVIFDTGAPHPYDPPASADEDETAPLVGFVQVFEAWLGKPLGIAVEVLRSLKADERLDYLHEHLAAARVLPADGDRDQLRGLVEVFVTNGRIRYLPPEDIFKSRIALLRASELPEEHIDEEQQARMREPSWGWSPFAAGPVAVHWVPGDHITMMTKPYVQGLADRLTACLAAAAAAGLPHEVCDVRQLSDG
ncbi:MAG: condensation domain-containing protein [Gammaproteobacteria bacterium]